MLPAGEALGARPTQRACNGRDNNTYQKIPECVRLGQVRAYQGALQEIADENDGNRFSGFSGFDASVEYVVESRAAPGGPVDETALTWSDGPAHSNGPLSN